MPFPIEGLALPGTARGRSGHLLAPGGVAWEEDIRLAHARGRPTRDPPTLKAAAKSRRAPPSDASGGGPRLGSEGVTCSPRPPDLRAPLPSLPPRGN